MWEGVGFSTKTTADEGSDHVDLVHRDIENGGQCAVRIMGHLLRRVELQSSIWIPMSNNCVGFCKSMMYASHVPFSM